jgi:PilZ domain
MEEGRRMDLGKPSDINSNWPLVEARRHPRYTLETDIRIYPRNSAVVRGHTVDVSESGISAMLRVEVPIGEVVRLEFTLPGGDVNVHALVRQRNAFRYGFQFVETSSAQDVIGRTCRQLAVEQAIFDPTKH